MNVLIRIVTLATLLVSFSLGGMAQRRITPVEPTPSTPGAPVKPDEAAELEAAKANLAERRDAQGNIVFVDTVTGREWVDTTAVAKTDKRMIYALLHSVNVGVDIWDPVMRIFGQGASGFGVWGQLNIHNRYMPTFEFGLGGYKDTPDDMNYTYRSSMAPYFKIGCDYNIFYNNSPDYQFLVGARYGFTNFKYRLTDCTIDDGYWPDGQQFSIPQQSSTAGYVELLIGVKVKIIKPISLGWTARFHSLIHESKATYGKPMYIPGFGKRGNAFSATFSIIYTLPLNTTPIQRVSNKKE